MTGSRPTSRVPSHWKLIRLMERTFPTLGTFIDGFTLAQPLVLSRQERARHCYLVGRTGSGKSTTLFNLAVTDLLDGEGLCVIDPHGDLVHELLDTVPPWRTREVCYFNAADRGTIVGFNPLAAVPRPRRSLAAEGIVSAFHHLWATSWGPRLEHFLRHALLALFEYPAATLFHIAPLFTDDAFRARLTRQLDDPAARRFWQQEFPGYDRSFRTEAVAPLLNKAGSFMASPALRGILGQVHPKFHFATAMDHRQIVLVNLAKGMIGEQPANLLGSLLVSHLQQVALGRADRAESQRTPFNLIIDEFQSLGSTVFASVLSEARKYGLSLTLAHQFTEQLAPEVRAAVLGNIATLFVFRVGVSDATLLSPEFDPVHATELVDQPPFRAWVKRGVLRFMKLVSLLHKQPTHTGRARHVEQWSRERFARPRPCS